MITITQYWMGRDETHPLALTPQIERDAYSTIDLANRLLVLAKGAGVRLSERAPWGIVSSGWRPPSVNASTPNASKTSHHMAGRAIDLYDPDGKLDAWMLANPSVLRDLGLWQEHPDATAGWAHVQTKPPASGNRVFKP